MTAKREEHGPRQDKAAPALRSEAKGKAGPGPQRRGPSWKKAARRIMAEAQPETAATASRLPEPGTSAVTAADLTSAQPADPAPLPDGAIPPAEAPASAGGGGDAGPAASEGASPKYRQQSRREATSGQSVPKQQAFRQESRQAQPADKLRHGAGAAAQVSVPHGAASGEVRYGQR